jgi:hypothetical protein
MLRRQRHLRPQLQKPQHLLLLPQPHRQPRLLRLHLLQHLEFLVLVTTHSHLHREWEFLVPFRVRVTILSHHHKEWVALVHLVQVVLVRQAPAVRVVQVAPVVPVVLRVQVPVVRVDSLAHLVQVLVAVLRVELRVPVALVVRAVAQVAVAVAA